MHNRPARAKERDAVYRRAAHSSRMVNKIMLLKTYFGMYHIIVQQQQTVQ